MGIDPEALIQGLQLPDKPAREAKVDGVKMVVLEAKLTNDQMKAREGTYFSEKEADTIYDEDVDVWAKNEDVPEGKVLIARFRKNVIPKELIEKAWSNFYNAASASRNRGAAAGPIDLKSKYWTKRKPRSVNKWSAQYEQNGKLSKMRVNNNVFSSVLGYF